MSKLTDFVAGYEKQKDAAEALGISRHALARAIAAEKGGHSPRAEIMKAVDKLSAKKKPVSKHGAWGRGSSRANETEKSGDAPKGHRPSVSPRPPAPSASPHFSAGVPVPKMVSVIPDQTDGTGDNFRIVGERSKFFAHHSYPGIYFYVAFGPVVSHRTKLVLRAKMFDSPSSVEVLKLGDEDATILEKIKDDAYLEGIIRQPLKVNGEVIKSVVEKMKTDWKRGKTEGDSIVEAILTLDDLRGELTNALFQRRVNHLGYDWMQELITFMRQRVALLPVR